MVDNILEELDNLFVGFIENHIKNSRLINLSAKGLFQLSKSFDIATALAEYKRVSGKEVNENDLQKVKDESEFVQEEVEKGLPILYGQGSVWIWANLEAFIEDLEEFCLDNDPSLMDIDSLKRIKIPLIQYDSLSPKERRYFLLETLERDIQSKYKQGISQFEVIFDLFGIGGIVDEKVKKDLLELCNIRNILIHRRGVADRKLIETCPWLGFSIGNPVQVSSDDFNKYSKAIIVYVGIVIKRIIIHFGGSTKKIDAFLNSLQ